MLLKRNISVQNVKIKFILKKCDDLYNKIYNPKDMSYWEELDKQVKEYADKMGGMLYL